MNPLDDPRLTAYALGELDVADMPAVESLLTESAEARALVADLRATAQRVANALAGESVPNAASATNRKGASTPRPHRRILRPRNVVLALSSVAAAFGVLAVLDFHFPRMIRVPILTTFGIDLSAEQRHNETTELRGLAAADEIKQINAPNSATTPTDQRNKVAMGTGGAPGGGSSAQSHYFAYGGGPTAGQSAGHDLSSGLPHGGPYHYYVGDARPNVRYGSNRFAADHFARGAYDSIALDEAGSLVSESRDQLHSADSDGVPALSYIPVVPAIVEPLRRDAFARLHDNPFFVAMHHPLSTFSIDVDTASYAVVRRMLHEGALPPPEAVRIEEFVNYFRFGYAQPTDERPFAANLEIAACPWNGSHRLVRVGIKGREVPRQWRPTANLVFLLDVSGSMSPPDRLPMLREAYKLFLDELNDDDRVAIVVYAGAAGLVLPSTPAGDRERLLAAIDSLEAGGSTNGGQGIQLAYDIAAENFIEGGVNRVVLATDGDFNVGIADRDALKQLVVERARSGVFLSVLGVGSGNLQDATLEAIADNGNGHYAYLDSLDEAARVLVEQAGGTLVTIAKDVKIQIEFNPATVAGYRLIGYENRLLAARDFNDDTKDAGEIGAGHTVTALYEIVPCGVAVPPPAAPVPATQQADDMQAVIADAGVDPLKYATPAELATGAFHPADAALLTLRIRYKLPDADTSELLEFAAMDGDGAFDEASDDFRFAASVAGLGMLLRASPYAGSLTIEQVIETASSALGMDEDLVRAEFVDLARRAQALLHQAAAPANP